MEFPGSLKQLISCCNTGPKFIATRMAFIDCRTKYAVPPGLKVVCSTLSSTETPSTNRNPTQIVHDACVANGFLAGWQALATLYPTVSLNSLLLDDIIKCIGVYERIRPGTPAAATYFHITISGDLDQLSLDKVPPKVVGGTSWILNDEYREIQKGYLSAEFPVMHPTITFGWPGGQRKVISRNDLHDCDTLMLLTTVELDLDRHEAFRSAFLHALAVGERCILKGGTRMQGAALAALLGFDLQVNVRTVEESWIAHGTVGGNLGPDDISPSDWVATLTADCAGYAPCGYEDEQCYRKTRTGMFTSVVMANLLDVVYDIPTSNRLSSALYASAAGVAKFNIHCAFVTSLTDAVAYRVLALNSNETPLFGDNFLLITGPWTLFIERYRLWERFVKYMRILRCSDSPKAQHILGMASPQMVLKDCDIDDVDDAWTKAMAKGSEKGLTHRITVAYPVSAAPEMAQIPGLPQPDLCPTCKVQFQEALLSFETDKFHGIPGLPTSVAACPAVARTAAIRRAAIYASEDACCDQCACKIGRWADAAGYMVFGSLMSNESATNASDWLLQSYAAWTVSLSPVSVMTVLSGFDLLSQVKCEDGAMGVRDVLYNWESA